MQPHPAARRNAYLKTAAIVLFPPRGEVPTLLKFISQPKKTKSVVETIHSASSYTPEAGAQLRHVR